MEISTKTEAYHFSEVGTNSPWTLVNLQKIPVKCKIQNPNVSFLTFNYKTFLFKEKLQECELFLCEVDYIWWVLIGLVVVTFISLTSSCRHASCSFLYNLGSH